MRKKRPKFRTNSKVRRRNLEVLKEEYVLINALLSIGEENKKKKKGRLKFSETELRELRVIRSTLEWVLCLKKSPTVRGYSLDELLKIAGIKEPSK